MNRDEPILVACLMGKRASAVALGLRAVGFSKARVYLGSMNEWVAPAGNLPLAHDLGRQGMV